MHTLLQRIGEGPFMKRTVRELLFEGWSLQNYVDLIVMLSEAAGIELPQLPEDPRFGLYYGVRTATPPLILLRMRVYNYTMFIC